MTQKTDNASGILESITALVKPKEKHKMQRVETLIDLILQNVSRNQTICSYMKPENQLTVIFVKEEKVHARGKILLKLFRFPQQMKIFLLKLRRASETTT